MAGTLKGASLVKWIQLLVTGITMGSIYSLIALGYVTIYRTSRIVNMAQGAFVMFGGFFAYSLLSEVGLPYWLSAILAIVAVMVLSGLMYLLVLKPLVKVSLVSIILATMALSILFESFSLLRWGGYGKSVPAFSGDKALFVGKVAVFPQSLWVIGLMIVVLIGLWLLTNRTRIGKQMTATANDPGAASLSGVNTGRMIILAFAIFRTQLFGPDDIENVKQVQAGYKLQPLSAFLKKPAPPAAPEVKWLRIDKEFAESDPFVNGARIVQRLAVEKCSARKGDRVLVY